MQRNVNKISLKSYLLEVNPNDYINDPDKLDFLGTYANPDSPIKLFRSVDKIKVNELLRALNSPLCWEKSIFNDSRLPYLALTAYLHNKISRQKISHILEFYELKLTYPDIIAIPILTKAGNFTYASLEYFEEIIQVERNQLPNVTHEHLEKFRISLLEGKNKLGSAFFVLYLRPSNHSNVRNHMGFSNLLGTIDSSDMGFMYIPSTVRNIFYPAITPKNSTQIVSTGTLGKFSIDMIEKSYRKKIRICALGFPGTFRTLRSHDQNSTLVDNTGHDAAHQAAINYFPEHLYNMGLFCVDILRKKTKIKWSAEFWPLIDMFVIDDKVNVLNFETNLKVQSYARTYAVNEALSEEQCREWIRRILKVSLQDLLFNIILHDMVINKSHWQHWIDVDRFIEENMTGSFKQCIQSPLSLSEISNHAFIHVCLINGFIINWQSITQSILSEFISFEKHYNNKIFFCLFNVPIHYYSNEELKSLLIDIEKNNLLGIELLRSASSGNLESVMRLAELNKEQRTFDYLLIALRLAAKNGHIPCVLFILNNFYTNILSKHYTYAMVETASRGHKECLNLLILKMESLEYNVKIYITHALYAAVKNNKSEIVNFFLSHNKANISLVSIIANLKLTLDRNDSLMTQQLLSYIVKRNKTQQLLEQFNIYKMLRAAPANCIAIIMDTFIGHSSLTYQSLFIAIAKNGSIECAKEFISYVNNKYINDNIERNKVVMDCMLQGFSSERSSMYFTQPFNLHHDIVKFQIDQYLQVSASNHFAEKQNSSPKNEDIKKLIDKIFLTSLLDKDQTLYSLCDIALNYLIQHEMIKLDKELNKYCMDTAFYMAMTHPEPYYLRLLFRAGAKINFEIKNNRIAIHNVLIKNLPSTEVKCLLYITYALHEMQKIFPNNISIIASLNLAKKSPTFEKEIFSLIYNNSIQVSLHTLRVLANYLCGIDKFTKLNHFIKERIAYLAEPELQLRDSRHTTMFNSPAITTTSNNDSHLSFVIPQRVTPR